MLSSNMPAALHNSLLAPYPSAGATLGYANAAPKRRLSASLLFAHRPKPHGLGFEFPAFDFGQEGEADLLEAVAVGPGLLSARAFGGLLQKDLAVCVVQLGGGEFEAKG